MSDDERTQEIARNGSGRLKNKIALVVGASRGIGAAVAQLFAVEGATVVLAARSEEALADRVNEITAMGGHAVAVKTDVSEAGSIEALVRWVVERYGRLDLAVNNAGMAGGNVPLAQVSEDVFDRVIAVNLKGTFLALKYELAAMQASGGGAIVNVSSTVGLIGNGAGIAPYIASKHGVVGLTRAAALEYARHHIRVNAVAPGTTRTPVNEHWLANEQISQRIIGAIPMGRVAESTEVAEAILWLCSDASSYLTGVSMPVDGGFVVA